MTINLNASAAYRISELLSIGVGFDAQYIDVTFSNALDFSTLCLANPATAPACRAFGLTTPGNPATDGHVEFTGSDWSYISIDLGYAHLFIDDAAVDNTEVITGAGPEGGSSKERSMSSLRSSSGGCGSF